MMALKGTTHIVPAREVASDARRAEAHAARLDRVVAITVLPDELAADDERCARLEREARAVAFVSHPHICTIHDVGSAPSSDPGHRTHLRPRGSIRSRHVPEVVVQRLARLLPRRRGTDTLTSGVWVMPRDWSDLRKLRPRPPVPRRAIAPVSDIGYLDVCCFKRPFDDATAGGAGKNARRIRARPLS
jgi:hypothetical protein